MHLTQHEVPAGLASALIAAQMPDLAQCALWQVGEAGTDNTLFRIGDRRVARFPRLPHAADQIAKEARWLPLLAPHLPLAVPVAERFGVPAMGYPHAWSVGPWLPGEDALAAPPDQMAAALALAEFLRRLHRLPVPADAPLQPRSSQIDQRLDGSADWIARFEGEADQGALLQLLTLARNIPPYRGPPVWHHGDLHPLNLLTHQGRLSAVIDWGSLGAGDPAMDYLAAWTLFDAPARALFRDTLSPDPDAWARGWAFAFSKAVAAIPYYRISNPRFRDAMQVTLARVMAEGPR
jgi:aminoglycoside phosphotransferase (APT) family kinase protein